MIDLEWWRLLSLLGGIFLIGIDIGLTIARRRTLTEHRSPTDKASDDG